jgi:hypothetical protein
MDIDKWADRVYAEEDFGKNIAISFSGLIGLIIYLIKSDFALAAFIAIIIFPLVKMLSRHIERKYAKNKKQSDVENKKKEIVEIVKNLTDRERRVIHEFVKYKSAVISSNHLAMNSIHMPDGATKSLKERGYLSIDSYGTPDEFDLILDLDIFEAGRMVFENE